MCINTNICKNKFNKNDKLSKSLNFSNIKLYSFDFSVFLEQIFIK